MIRERDTILIIDFGSQYTQLIARRIRENRIFSLVKPHTLTMKEFNEIKPKGVILSGGPDSVTSLKKIKMSIDIRKLSIPILGICYGMQYIADAYGGKVSKSKKKEFGHSIFMAKKASKIFPKKIINKNINVEKRTNNEGSSCITNRPNMNSCNTHLGQPTLTQIGFLLHI